MPDITMCPSIECPFRKRCYRSECSGTVPSKFRQSYFLYVPYDEETGSCEYYLYRVMTMRQKELDDAFRTIDRDKDNYCHDPDWAAKVRKKHAQRVKAREQTNKPW